MQHHRSSALLLTTALLCGFAWVALPARAGDKAEITPADKRLDKALFDVVNRGAQLYNSGDQAGCCGMFEAALMTARALLDHRPKLQQAIDTGLEKARAIGRTDDRAFALREALDQVLAGIRPAPPAGKQPPPDKSTNGFQLTAEEQAVLDLTNKERARQGLAPLRPDPKLFAAARVHSANMARLERLAHDLEGKGPGERLRDAGYQSAGWGENCAAGQRTAAEAMASWMSSDGHRGNILNGNYTEIGIGVVASSRGGLYWTQVFARPAR